MVNCLSLPVLPRVLPGTLCAGPYPRSNIRSPRGAVHADLAETMLGFPHICWSSTRALGRISFVWLVLVLIFGSVLNVFVTHLFFHAVFFFFVSFPFSFLET